MHDIVLTLPRRSTPGNVNIAQTSAAVQSLLPWSGHADTGGSCGAVRGVAYEIADGQLLRAGLAPAVRFARGLRFARSAASIAFRPQATTASRSSSTSAGTSWYDMVIA